MSLADRAAEERVSEMKTMPVATFFDKLPFAQYFVGTAETEFLPDGIDLLALKDPMSKYGKPSWCEEVVFGCTAHDVSLDVHLGHKHYAETDGSARALCSKVASLMTLIFCRRFAVLCMSPFL